MCSSLPSYLKLLHEHPFEAFVNTLQGQVRAGLPEDEEVHLTVVFPNLALIFLLCDSSVPPRAIFCGATGATACGTSSRLNRLLTSLSGQQRSLQVPRLPSGSSPCGRCCSTWRAIRAKPLQPTKKLASAIVSTRTSSTSAPLTFTRSAPTHSIRCLPRSMTSFM